MRIALCNEVIAGMEFAEQCDFAAALGYDGLEIAPFTLGEEPHRLPPSRVAELRRAVADAGLATTSLHWLLVRPTGLSITSADPAVREKTLDVMRRLIGLCAELGGKVLVHGSPAQRRLPAMSEQPAAIERGIEAFAIAGEAARAAGVTYCIEPLAASETAFVNWVQEAVTIVQRIGNPHLRTMVDASAAAQTEREPVADLLARWLPTGMIAHVQVNDRNRRGPGQGTDRFAEVFAVLKRHGYAGDVAVEPFEYVPDGPAAAARAIGYLRGILEAQS
ncbi:sugar phosphate isomerase/epimerase family protein [Desertibaculum subflavum]|uniref:sugar phosphate isomerase/epimerase family protein n=1 Tax=Desertibaculum subflavum TaxID=2268458 RepID=UPI000E662423